MTTLLYCRRRVKPAGELNKTKTKAMNTSHPFDLVLGLDRSDRKADLHLIDTRSGQRRTQTIDTSPEALWEWLLQLRQQHPQARVALCLEQPAGHLIAFLEAYDWITLYPINPITLQKFREAFVTSRAKDDAKDALYLAELLLTHHDKLKAWAPEDSQTRAVQQIGLSSPLRGRRAHRADQSPQGPLKTVFSAGPGALRGRSLASASHRVFCSSGPASKRCKKPNRQRSRQFYHLNGSRSQQALEQRLALIEKAVPVTDETTP